MKYLSDYMESKQTDLFKSTGAFFAFSGKQFNEQKVKGTKYYNLGGGMLCPKDTTETLTNGLDTIHKDAIQFDIKENGIKGIIHRELGNHECQISMSYDDVIDALEPYGITEEQIKGEWNEYFAMCVKKDYF